MSWKIGKKTCKVCQGGHNQVAPQHPNQWIALPPRMLKCNADAAMFLEENRYICDMCLRDKHGVVIQVRTVWFRGTQLQQKLGICVKQFYGVVYREIKRYCGIRLSASGPSTHKPNTIYE